VIQYLNAHPEDTTTQFYLLGSPSTPGDATLNVQKLPTGHYNVTFVVRQYDIAADKPAGTANNARGNLSQSIHLNGYNNLNLTAPAITWTDPRTGSVTEYFLTYPLPEISTAFKTAAQIAAEDRAKRPGVESQYYLPGKVQRPVVLPAPVYPATAVATTVSTPVATAAVSGGTPVPDSGGTAAASGATSVSDSGGTAAVSGGTSVSDSGGTAAANGDSDRHTTVTHDRAHRQQSPQHNRRGHKNS
jgi:hypothetical protein